MRKDNTFKGFETWLTIVKMNVKMHINLMLLLLLAQVTISVWMSWHWYGEKWRYLATYVFRSIVRFKEPYGAFEYTKKVLIESKWIFFTSSLIWASYPFLLRIFKARAKRQSVDQYVRGSRLIESKELNKAITKDREPVDISLGPIQIPISAEVKHFFIVGRPGVGKTVVITQVIDTLERRGAKGIIYDFKGDYTSRFYDPKRDMLLNPLDVRSVGWTLFNEVQNFTDIDAIAHSLIPPANQSDPFWIDAGRDVFSGILHYLYQQGRRTNKDIWEAVTAPGKDIAEWLKATKGGERGYRYIEDASSKLAMSVFAVMMQYTKSFEFMAAADGNFSVKKWLEDDRPGFIFVTNYSDIKDTLKPVLSLFIDLLGRKLLSMKDDYNRRIFFLLDEFGTLQSLPTIIQLLTLSRSKGGSCWIGIQDIGQLDKLYTVQLRQSIVNACGGNLIFAVADPDSAKFLSDKIGDAEYIGTEETYSMGTENAKDGINLARRKRIEKLALPSDIQNLKDLECFLKLPNYDLTRIQLDYKGFECLHEPFIIRPDLNME